MRRWLAIGRMTAALAAAATFAAPAAAETVHAKVSAKIVKPLVLRSIQNLDMGTVILGPGTWSGATLALSANGTLRCPTRLTCSGATQVAEYNVTGSQQMTVHISAPDVTLVNQSNPARTLTLVVDGPKTVTLTNSGSKGVDFALGGSIKIDSTTADGTYAGEFNVTVDY